VHKEIKHRKLKEECLKYFEKQENHNQTFVIEILPLTRYKWKYITSLSLLDNLGCVQTLLNIDLYEG
jgi:hypothetical protein